MSRRLPSLCTISSTTASGADSKGNQTVDVAVKAENVNCRFRRMSAAYREKVAQNNKQVSHRFYFKPGTNIVDTDIITVGGTIYDVVTVYDAKAQTIPHLEVDANER